MRQCSCGQKIVQERSNGEIAIKNRIILAKSDGVYAVCPHCKAENKIEELHFQLTSHVILNNSANSTAIIKNTLDK